MVLSEKVMERVARLNSQDDELIENIFTARDLLMEYNGKTLRNNKRLRVYCCSDTVSLEVKKLMGYKQLIHIECYHDGWIIGATDDIYSGLRDYIRHDNYLSSNTKEELETKMFNDLVDGIANILAPHFK